MFYFFKPMRCKIPPTVLKLMTVAYQQCCLYDLTCFFCYTFLTTGLQTRRLLSPVLLAWVVTAYYGFVTDYRVFVTDYRVMGLLQIIMHLSTVNVASVNPSSVNHNVLIFKPMRCKIPRTVLKLLTVAYQQCCLYN